MTKHAEQWRPPKRSHAFLTADGWVTESYVPESAPNVLTRDECRLLTSRPSEMAQVEYEAWIDLRTRLSDYAKEDS
jgi:hypothetical protein